MSKLYSEEAVTRLIERYQAKGGEITAISEGSLMAFGLAILHGEGLKTTVIKEKYLNAWSSAYTARTHNRMPKVYEKMINV